MEQTDFPAWSIACYGRENVEESCLRLQDEYGLDVNVVLFCYWFGAHHGVIGEDAWQRIDDLSRQWQGRLIRPLREARRWLKVSGCESDQEKHALRMRIKDDEIFAELLQQRMMQDACEATGDGAPSDSAAAARRNAEELFRRRGISLDGKTEKLLAAISAAVIE